MQTVMFLSTNGRVMNLPPMHPDKDTATIYVAWYAEQRHYDAIKPGPDSAARLSAHQNKDPGEATEEQAAGASVGGGREVDGGGRSAEQQQEEDEEDVVETRPGEGSSDEEEDEEGQLKATKGTRTWRTPMRRRGPLRPRKGERSSGPSAHTPYLWSLAWRSRQSSGRTRRSGATTRAGQKCPTLI